MKRTLGVILLVTVISCARASSTGSSADPTAPARSSDVITASELSNASVIGGDALEAVRRLRPRFLATRGVGSVNIANAGTVHISIDGSPLQPLNMLSSMRAAQLAEIRFLSASEAAQRFGTNSGSGAVLLVKTLQR